MLKCVKMLCFDMTPEWHECVLQKLSMWLANKQLYHRPTYANSLVPGHHRPRAGLLNRSKSHTWSRSTTSKTWGRSKYTEVLNNSYIQSWHHIKAILNTVNVPLIIICFVYIFLNNNLFAIPWFRINNQLIFFQQIK